MPTRPLSWDTITITSVILLTASPIVPVFKVNKSLFPLPFTGFFPQLLRVAGVGLKKLSECSLPSRTSSPIAIVTMALIREKGTKTIGIGLGKKDSRRNISNKSRIQILHRGHKLINRGSTLCIARALGEGKYG